MKAVIVGATGAVGKDLVEILLRDEVYERIDAFVRRDMGIHNEKLNVHIIDFEKTESWADDVKGDVLFSCLGTTLKLAGSKEAQWRVDHDYQLEFAKAAAKNGVKKYILVSSMWASSSSMSFYTKMKGVLEDEVRKLPFEHIVILQPPSLIRKNTDRPAENVSIKIINGLNKLGILRSMKPMDTATVATAMQKLAISDHTGVEVIENQKIVDVVAKQ